MKLLQLKILLLHIFLNHLLKLNGKVQIIFLCIKGNKKLNLAEMLSS